MRFEQKDRVELLKAIAASFESHELDMLLIGEIGLDLAQISSPLNPKPVRAQDLERYFHQRNEAERLLALLRDARPSVAEFTIVAENAGLVIFPAEGDLEVLINSHVPGIHGSPFQSPSEFRSKMAVRENSICRVEIPSIGIVGTGTLVSENLVITNFHVIEKALDEKGNIAHNIACSFNYREWNSSTSNSSVSSEVLQIICSSPYIPSGDPAGSSSSFLDYALLRIDQKLAVLPVVDGGEMRGSTPIEKSVGVVKNQGVLAIQHPKGEPLRMDLGTVTSISADRIRHSINTLPGSSGSPIFDAALRFVALHHVGVDWPQGGMSYNQAVPVPLIAEDIAANGITLGP